MCIVLKRSTLFWAKLSHSWLCVRACIFYCSVFVFNMNFHKVWRIDIKFIMMQNTQIYRILDIFSICFTATVPLVHKNEVILHNLIQLCMIFSYSVIRDWVYIYFVLIDTIIVLMIYVKWPNIRRAWLRRRIFFCGSSFAVALYATAGIWFAN